MYVSGWLIYIWVCDQPTWHTHTHTHTRAHTCCKVLILRSAKNQSFTDCSNLSKTLFYIQVSKWLTHACDTSTHMCIQILQNDNRLMFFKTLKLVAQFCERVKPKHDHDIVNWATLWCCIQYTLLCVEVTVHIRGALSLRFSYLAGKMLVPSVCFHGPCLFVMMKTKLKET